MMRVRRWRPVAFAASLACSLLGLSAWPAAATPGFGAGEPLYDESAAFDEGGTPYRLNPAGISARYPNEFAIGWIDDPLRKARITGTFEARGSRLTLGGSQDDVLDYSVGHGGGNDAMRQGIEAAWRHDPRGGRVTWPAPAGDRQPGGEDGSSVRPRPPAADACPDGRRLAPHSTFSLRVPANIAAGRVG